MPPVDLIGGPTVLNTITTGIQFTPTVAALNNGGFVAAWTDFGSASPDDPTQCVRAQIFDAAGAKVGLEFRVNTVTALAQTSPQVAVLSDGSFVIAFNHEFSAVDADIRAQRFSQNGTPIGAEFGIATAGGGVDEFLGELTANNLGQYLAVWGQDDNIVRFRQNNNDGTLASGPGTIDPPPNANQSFPVATTLVNGTYVAAWVETGEIFQRPLVGAAPGTLANTTTANAQRSATIQALENGGYVVSWVDTGPGVDEPFVLAQRYDAAGNKVGGEITVNEAPQSIDFTGPHIAALGNGSFFIFWDDRNLGLRGQTFDSNGAKTGGVVQITPPTGPGSFGAADVAVLADGDTVAVFGGTDGPANSGIQAQRMRIFSTVNGDAGANNLVGALSALNPGAAFHFALNGLGGNDTLQGSLRNDIIDGGADSDTGVTGYAPGDDYEASGTTANFTISGVMGTDQYLNMETLNMGGTLVSVQDFLSNLNLTGTKQADTLNGFAGNDNINGKKGDDTLNGGAGSDVMLGGKGADTMKGGSGADQLIGGKGVDNLSGGSGNDVLLGGKGADTLDGGAGNDILDGGKGADTLKGGAGIDNLTGGKGADSLDGGLGADNMNGGKGADTFIYNSILESGPAAGARDVISAFEGNGKDLINVSAIDAITGGANDAFTFIGAAAFTAAGQIRATVAGAVTTIELNVDAALAADMAIDLTLKKGVIDAADFVL